MPSDDELIEDLWERNRQLKRHNDFLQYQNGLLQEAIETICYAFLNNSKDLETAIQTAMSLQQKARQAPDSQIKPW
jgi:cell division protein FtsB